MGIWEKREAATLGWVELRTWLDNKYGLKSKAKSVLVPMYLASELVQEGAHGVAGEPESFSGIFQIGARERALFFLVSWLRKGERLEVVMFFLTT